MKDSKVLLDNRLLQLIPEEIDSELDKVLDEYDIDRNSMAYTPIILEILHPTKSKAKQSTKARKHQI